MHAQHNHHAVLLVGDFSNALLCVPEEYRTPSVDVQFIERDTFSIGDARTLKEQSSAKPVTLTKRCFVLSVQQFQREAQHALLKLFEDPPSTAQFYVIIGHDRGLLPTLRSRFHTVRVKEKVVNEDDVASFFKASYGEQLEEITAHHKKKDDVWMQNILDEAEKLVSQGLQQEGGLIAGKELLRARGYAHNRGASKKMLLEHMILSLPRG